MNITVIGTGYVGLVTGICLSDVGNKVICLDTDTDKVKLLKSGKCPIYEPGLDSKLKDGIESKTLFFTSNPKKAIEESDIIFIAVGTPSLASGDTDLSYIKSAIRSILENLNNDKIIEIRGVGLMLALEFNNSQIANKLVELCLKKGLILFYFLLTDTAVRISPALTISKQEIEKGCNIINEVLEKLE